MRGGLGWGLLARQPPFVPPHAGGGTLLPPRLEGSESRRRKSGRTRRRGKEKAPATADGVVPTFAARSAAIEAGRGKNGGGETLDVGACALLPSASSPRRPDNGPGRKRQDSGAAMAGGLSWPRRSDGLTFCGWLRLSWAGGGGFSSVAAVPSILQSDEPIYVSARYVTRIGCLPDTAPQNATSECQPRPPALALCVAGSSAARRCPLSTVYCPPRGDARTPEPGAVLTRVTPPSWRLARRHYCEEPPQWRAGLP